MTQSVIGPDGVEHQFPDEATQDQMMGVIKQNYPQLYSGAGVTPAPNLAAGAGSVSSPPPTMLARPVTPTPDNSPATTALAHIFLAPYRQYQAAKDYASTAIDAGTMGVSDRLSALMGGTKLADEQAQTQAARDRLGPVIGPVAAGTGYALGPGKVLGPAAKFVAGPLAGVAGGIVPSMGEGAVAGGINAAANNGDIVGGAVQGAAMGTVAPAVTGVLGKVAGALPSWAGGKPSVPTTDQLFKTADAPGASANDIRNWDLSQRLDAYKYNADNANGTLPSQVSAYLTKDPVTGLSQAQKDGLSPEIIDSLQRVGNTTPISSGVMKHPIIAGGALSGLAGLATHALTGGGLAESAAGGIGVGEVAHLGAYMAAKMRSDAAANSALNDVRRVAGGVPTTGPAQNAVNSSAAQRALHALIFGGAMGY